MAIIFNYADKPDFSMIELTSLIEDKMNIKLSSVKIPFFIGMIGGYIFDLYAIITRKKYSLSSVRVKKFCATTQFDASKVQNTFPLPKK